MTKTTVRGHRGASALVLIAGGGAVAVATWVSGSRWLAITLILAYACCAAIVFVWAGRSGDAAAILRAGGDERQVGLDREATALMGLAMTAAAIVGAIASIARTGAPGDYGVMCMVSGIAYVASFLVLKQRR